MSADILLLVSSDLLDRQAAGLFSSVHRKEHLPAVIIIGSQVSLRLIKKVPEDIVQDGLVGGRSVSRPVYLDDNYPLLKEVSKSGLTTVWLNRGGEIAPDATPLHDDDIKNLQDLVGLQQRLAVHPSLKQCLAWWEEWDLTENVRAHSQTVAWAAYALGVLLRERGLPIDPILAHRGGLVHDLDKIETLNIAGGHGALAGEFLEERGYATLGRIAREHIMHTILDSDAAKRCWESKLVYFCDKCVEGDRIVPFDQRLEKLIDRYPRYQKSMRQAEAPIWALSAHICAILDLSSHEAMIRLLKGMHMDLSG